MDFLSRQQVLEIKKLLNLDDTQTALLEQNYCIDMSKINEKVFYSYDIDYNPFQNCECGQGIITKQEYEYLKRENVRHPKRVYYSRKIEENLYFKIRFSDLNFSDDIDSIEEFYAGDDDDSQIFCRLNLNSDDDKYDSNDDDDSDDDD